MSNLIQPSAIEPVKRKRGRPKLDVQERQRFWQARGLNPLHASEILARATDEMSTWKRILAEDDPRVVLQAMMFLVSMRDGKPAQQINVTSQSLNVTVDDIAKARAIVAELRGSTKPMLGAYVPMPSEPSEPSGILDNDEDKGS